MKKENFLIYGSYGFTGNLIAQLAIRHGFRPVLGGRDKVKLEQQAKALNLDYRLFDLDDLEKNITNLKEYICVIHCAGPFIHTYRNMVKACLAAETHYLDITGEVEVIENLTSLNQEAKAARIMILPGAGFDVVPSDCLAQHLKSRLADATELRLAINTLQSSRNSRGMSVSRGTAKTILAGLASGTLIRDAGKLKLSPGNSNSKQFNFGNDKYIRCELISWGDLASAWWSTGIPHLETYMAIPHKVSVMFKLINPFKSIFKWKFVQKFIQNKINRLPEGPSDEMRKHSSSIIYGEAKNAAGKKVISTLKTPNGYDLTASTAIAIVKKIQGGEAPIGFQTPSTAYGKDWILELTGVTREDINRVS